MGFAGSVQTSGWLGACRQIHIVLPVEPIPLKNFSRFLGSFEPIFD